MKSGQSNNLRHYSRRWGFGVSDDWTVSAAVASSVPELPKKEDPGGQHLQSSFCQLNLLLNIQHLGVVSQNQYRHLFTGQQQIMLVRLQRRKLLGTSVIKTT
ncbi:hypothetical protein E4T56_gene7195 [Termitomyces sp. T112]|nr:hypothetical protein E4T56_gene7195 [Termitomyces sp. T112]